MGIDPIESLVERSLIKDTKTSRLRDIAKPQPGKKMSAREKQNRETLEREKSSTFYLNRVGELIQRILVHLPFDLAEQLRVEAFESVPRKTFSELIREKLRE
jgi:hypothetical protein